jgi:hypothetical protein
MLHARACALLKIKPTASLSGMLNFWRLPFWRRSTTPDRIDIVTSLLKPLPLSSTHTPRNQRARSRL